jgi:hypothetical protein
MLKHTLINLWWQVQATEALNRCAQNARRKKICNKMWDEKKKDLSEIKVECCSIIEKMLLSVRFELNTLLIICNWKLSLLIDQIVWMLICIDYFRKFMVIFEWVEIWCRWALVIPLFLNKIIYFWVSFFFCKNYPLVATYLSHKHAKKSRSTIV